MRADTKEETCRETVIFYKIIKISISHDHHLSFHVAFPPRHHALSQVQKHQYFKK